jgi:hypothetical protein
MDPCSCTFWDKVQCANGRITSLAMGAQGMPPSSGIPLALLDLTGLRLLCLDTNRLVGTIPRAISRLPGLRYLDLHANLFTGSVPTELVQLNQLTTIGLNANSQLSGVLPAFNFSQFTGRCTMNGDPFTCPLPAGAETCVGGAPTCILACNGTSGNLTANDCAAWQHTVRSSAYFTKASPPGCQEPGHLLDPCSCTDIGCNGDRIVSVHLIQRRLAFDASKDDSLSLLGALSKIDLWRNELVGPVPMWAMELTSLSYLAFGFNQLTGAIPSQLGELTGLTTLWINDNLFTGSVPTELVQLNQLTTIGLANSQLSGVLPAFNFSQFTRCSMNGDPFTCPLPAGAETCVGGAPTCILACNGTSGNLTANDCAAWQHFSRDPHFSATLLAKCPAAVLDPCSCTFYDHVQCADGRITHLHMNGQSLAGPFPASLLKLAGLTLL